MDSIASEYTEMKKQEIAKATSPTITRIKVGSLID